MKEEFLIASTSQDPRKEVLTRSISEYIMRGWSIETQNDEQYFAILRYTPPKRVNHVLHFFITLITCLMWGIVWIILSVNAEKDQRMRITVDENLVVSIETIQIG